MTVQGYMKIVHPVWARVRLSFYTSHTLPTAVHLFTSLSVCTQRGNNQNIQLEIGWRQGGWGVGGRGWMVGVGGERRILRKMALDRGTPSGFRLQESFGLWLYLCKVNQYM